MKLTQKLKQTGFTLIELLVVVAIISILASIAVPNFLEAQTRAKVSRAKNDMRVLATAVEAYGVIHTKYPKRHYGDDNPNHIYAQQIIPSLATRLQDLKVLTTPEAFITKLPVDVFEKTIKSPFNIIEYYDPIQSYRLFNAFGSLYPKLNMGWLMLSVGPDGYIGYYNRDLGYPPVPSTGDLSIYVIYEPTRGTISPGNIYRTQAESELKGDKRLFRYRR